jgi:hypothetical protein
MIKFDDVMKTLTDPGELSTFKQLKQAAALLQHYHDALVRLGDRQCLINVKPFWNKDNGLEVHMEMEHFARIDYAQNALEGVSDE